MIPFETCSIHIESLRVWKKGDLLMCGVITESKEIMVPSVFKKKKTTNKQKNADLNAY